jgi:hypothetical protein
MEVHFEKLEDLRFDPDQQVQWWDKNKTNLTDEQVNEIFNWATEEKFSYLELLIEITLENVSDPELLVQDLERISPYVDQDIAWGKLVKEFKSRLNGNPELAKEIYQKLINHDDDWLIWLAGSALANTPEDYCYDQIIELLRSDNIDKTSAGVQAIILAFDEEDIPDQIVGELISISERDEDEYLYQFINASRASFLQNDALWERTVELGEEHPSILIGSIISNFAGKIEDRHFDDFLSLIKMGLESESDINIQRASYFLHSRFSNRIDDLTSFVIWLSEYDLYEAGRLAREISEESPAFYAKLERNKDKFSSSFFAETVLSESKEYVDPDISELSRLLEAALSETDPNKKGDLLEEAASHLVSLIEDFEHKMNIRATEEEIDILVHNRFDNHIRHWGTPILIECKNRQEKVQGKHIRNVEGKIRNRGASTGFFVARSTFTEGAETQVAQCRMRDIQIGLIRISDLTDLSSSDEIIGLFEDKFDEINEM